MYCIFRRMVEMLNCHIGLSRFGKVKNCEVIRDQKTGDSLQYAFVEFYDQPACEQAYFKMDNVLIGTYSTYKLFIKAKIKFFTVRTSDNHTCIF